MKLLSIAIPCYNSSLYMRKCIDSLLPGGEDVEIIIVNDGSADNTPDIAEEYRQRFPGIVKVVNKENGGHGSAVNAGIEHASGLYFKVVDSDDWVSQSAYIQILDKLRELLQSGNSIDMLVSNFVYEKEGEKRRKVMKYHHALPQDEIFTWRDVRHFRVGQYILMHSVIYRTNLLRDCGLKLPENTFYVDNIFVFNPLPYVRTMYYMDVNFYRYFIGRADQSVNEQVMIGRIDQQIRVNKLMIDYFVDAKLPSGKLRYYMIRYLEIMMVISSILAIRSGTEENLEKKRELWKYIKEYDLRLFHRLRKGIMGRTMNLPGKSGRKISVAAYKISQKVIGFN